MIEVFRKGFRLDIDPSTLVTFKKAQNLNGIQSRYSFSNNITVTKTANNKKLLELFDLPTNKVSSLMNGYEVDVVLNGSIQLRNQTMKLTKETLDKIELYFLWSDSALVSVLKNTFINSLVTDLKYKKTIADFNALKNGADFRTVLVETQPKSGLFVIEEMPGVIRLQELLKRVFVTNNYSVYGDFFGDTGTFKDYWVAPNQGFYQIYSGGVGFTPTFDPTLDAYTFLNQVLQFFNCYASVDDTYKTVIINSWANLGSTYKSNYIDYSRFFDIYQDYAFQSKLAKRNAMTYSDSGATFNSFFPNNLSDNKEATYLASAFGAGSLNTFDDSTIQDDGTIELRANGAVGEISAARIFKLSAADISKRVYQAGTNGISFGIDPAYIVTAKKATAVSMVDVYNEFHKAYTDFILTPLIANHVFNYDDIMAADFSMTKVFFVEQLSSYWIPLDLGFSTAKDKLIVKAMLVKKRKVESPTLNNYNAISLDFKEKALVPLEILNGMYPMPPNNYPWDIVTFKTYNQNKNKLFINDVLVPANTLPLSFDMSSIVTMKIEANKVTDIAPDTNTDSLYLQAIDTNGGVSNEAYINIKHTGVANLESRFKQNEAFTYIKSGFDSGVVCFSPGNYVAPTKPNLNDTIESAVQIGNESGPNDTFNLVVASENYTNVTIDIKPFNVHLRTDNNDPGKARAVCKLVITGEIGDSIVLKEESVTGTSSRDFVMSGSYVIPNFNTGHKIRAFVQFEFDNRQTSNSGSMDVELTVSNFEVIITTKKTV